VSWVRALRKQFGELFLARSSMRIPHSHCEFSIRILLPELSTYYILLWVFFYSKNYVIRPQHFIKKQIS
jgi:hypothetical protein